MIFVSAMATYRSGLTCEQMHVSTLVDMDEEPTEEEWDSFQEKVNKNIKESMGAESVSATILNYKKMRG